MMNCTCVLCNSEIETINHLFFSCSYSRAVCRDVADWIQVQAMPTSFSEWPHWLNHLASQNAVKSKVTVAAMAAAVS